MSCGSQINQHSEFKATSGTGNQCLNAQALRTNQSVYIEKRMQSPTHIEKGMFPSQREDESDEGKISIVKLDPPCNSF